MNTTDCRNKSSNKLQNLKNVRDISKSRGKSAIARGGGPEARTTYNRKVSVKIDAQIVFSCRAPTVQTAKQVTQISNRQTEILQTPN